MSLPDCVLLTEGWGRAILHVTRPLAGKKWTDTGRLHGERGLKSRQPGGTRPVPLPPELVVLWRESIQTFGTAEDGQLFFNEHGGIVRSNTHYGVWHEARALALPPDVADSPLAARPYDLRHSVLPTWLNAGANPTEVAERAGNSVEVLMTRYVKCRTNGHSPIRCREASGQRAQGVGRSRTGWPLRFWHAQERR